MLHMQGYEAILDLAKENLSLPFLCAHFNSVAKNPTAE